MNRPTGRDDGFSMVEIIVSMVILALVALASAQLTMHAAQAMRGNQGRVVGANIVATQLEAARNMSAAELTAGVTTLQQTVGGKTYTIRQTIVEAPAVGTGNPCTATSLTMGQKAVSVEVTWPDMAGVAPLRGDVSIAYPAGVTPGTSNGSLTAKVRTPGGSPISNSTVVLQGQGGFSRSAVTDSGGCAAFLNVPPPAAGTFYSVVATRSGHLAANSDSTSARVDNLTVTAGGLTRSGDLVMAPAATIPFAMANGWQPPAGTFFMLRHSASSALTSLPLCTPTSQTACYTAIPGEVRNVAQGAYQLSHSACTSKAGAIVVTANAPSATTVSVPVPVAKVEVKKAGVVSTGAATITAQAFCATPFTPSAVPDGPTQSFGSLTGATRDITLSPGEWRITATVNGVTAFTNIALSSNPQTVTVNVP